VPSPAGSRCAGRDFLSHGSIPSAICLD
jgi:hypothetical protein